jgi:vitamin B12 transporter
MHSPIRSRLAGFFLAAFACAAPIINLSRAQGSDSPSSDQPVRLDTYYVVSATRTPQDPMLTPSTVTLVPLEDLQVSQVEDLQVALSEVPGVDVANSGAAGGLSSVFIRGGNSDQTLFIVDGVRLNTRTADYNNFLGGADLSGLDRVEVLQGPQSTLYGSSAMGGVILLETAHGSSTTTGTISGYGGSFGSLGGEAAAQGEAGPVGYSASLSREETDNDRANNAYKNWNYSGRLEDQVTSSLEVGATIRGQVGHYEEPGPTFFPGMDNIQTVDDLATAYAQLRIGDHFDSRLTTAWYQDEYTFDGGSDDAFYERNTRDILDWQNTWKAAAWAEVVAGINAEGSQYDSGGAMTSDRSLAGYLSATFRPIEHVELTAGLRRDDFNTAGSATTGRVGAAYLANGGATKLRATYGTGFNVPSPDERFGDPPYLIPNPGIRPERSRGWDAGFDQQWLKGTVTFSATYFENQYRDLLAEDFTDPIDFIGQEINVDRATTRGVEVGASTKLADLFTARVSYAYLDAQDDTTGARLIERPRHTFDGDLERQFTHSWLVGAGVHLIADRVDELADGPGPLGGYAAVRLFTSYSFRHNLAVKLRIENLFDRSYQEVAGYPALPLAFYGSTEWKF